MNKTNTPGQGLKAIIFDLMGTCCDWHSSILPALQSCPSTSLLPGNDLPKFATDWRAGFFAEIHARFEAGEPAEDIDVTHRRVLDQLLQGKGIDESVWGENARQKLVDQWHVQIGWPDAIPGITKLRENYFVVVLANGTTRLQLDITKSSRLPFHALFSSQLMGLTKPDPKIYLKTLELMKVEPHECLMVAAHAYDLRAAKNVGIHTAYMQRTTEDLIKDMSVIRGEVDMFFDGTSGDEHDGIGALAKYLAA